MKAEIHQWRGVAYRGYMMEPGYQPGPSLRPCVYVWEYLGSADGWQPVRMCPGVPQAQEWIDQRKPFTRLTFPIGGTRWDALELSDRPSP